MGETFEVAPPGWSTGRVDIQLPWCNDYLDIPVMGSTIGHYPRRANSTSRTSIERVLADLELAITGVPLKALISAKNPTRKASARCVHSDLSHFGTPSFP